MAHSIIDKLRLTRFLRGLGPESGPVVLDRHRIFILPTRHGFLLACVLFIMLLGSINYNNSLGYGLTFLLASLGVVSILHTYRNLDALQFSVVAGQPVYAGEVAEFYLHIQSMRDTKRYHLQLDSGQSDRQRIDVENTDTFSIALRFPTQFRGRLTLPRLTLSTVFPLGLFRAWSYLHFDNHCLVYPQPAINSLALPVQNESDLAKQKYVVGLNDFIGLRNYQAGDSIRHIHWKTVAKNEKLLTKLFASYPANEVNLDWDYLAGYSTESKLSHLCRWVVDAHQQKLRYAMRIPGNTIVANSGSAHKRQCLESLALFGLNP